MPLFRALRLVCAAQLTRQASSLARAAWSDTNFAKLQSLLDQPVIEDHGQAPVAAFDADGTLWSGDAFSAFTSILIKRGLLTQEECDRVAVEYAKSEEEERRVWLMESFALFRGMRLEDLRSAADEAWDTFGPAYGAQGGLRDTLRPEMADLVRSLRGAGWRVLIVTASPAEAVYRGAQALGVPEGDVLAIRLETDAHGVVTGRPSTLMPLTWRDGKAAALQAHGLAARLRLGVGNSDDDVPMLRLCAAQPGGHGLLCVPRAAEYGDPWAGAAEDTRRLAALAADSGFWLHKATAGPEDHARLARELAAAPRVH